MTIKLILVSLLLFAFAGNAFSQNDDGTVAIIKKNLADSKESIKKYEWIETTVTYLKGEEKSTKQNRCYYDVTGKLTKVATGGGTPPPKKKGGIRGKIVANKTEDMQEYIKECIAKIQTYLPPDAAKIQQIYGSGKVGVHILEPGKIFKLDFPGYNQPRDMLSITVDKNKKMLNGIAVNTYLEKPDDKVSFQLSYQTLPDGTQYPGTTTLIGTEKNVKIVIQNSGYKKMAG